MAERALAVSLPLLLQIVTNIYLLCISSETFRDDLKQWTFDSKGFDYFVVSVLGVQSSGKSSPPFPSSFVLPCLFSRGREWFLAICDDFFVQALC